MRRYTQVARRGRVRGLHSLTFREVLAVHVAILEALYFEKQVHALACTLVLDCAHCAWGGNVL